MTNRDMVKQDGAKPADPARDAQTPRLQPLPPLPAEEDAAHPTTRDEPLDSPQANENGVRSPPAPGEIGLTTRR